MAHSELSSCLEFQPKGVNAATITSPRKPGPKRLVWYGIPFWWKKYDFKVLGERGPAAEAEVQLATIVLEHERTSQERHNIV